jgi:hypothetical protein
MTSEEQDDPHAVTPRQPKSIVQFLRESPLAGVELDLARDEDTGRDLEFAEISKKRGKPLGCS